MTAAIESALFLALAAALATASASRRGLAAASILLAAAASLPMHAPCTLAAAVLVAADGASVELALPLLAAAGVGLASIAAPSAIPPIAGALSVAVGARAALAIVRRRPRAHALVGAAARVALALALGAELAGAHRLAPLVRASGATLAAALGLVAFSLDGSASAALARRRLAASVRRARIRKAPAEQAEPPRTPHAPEARARHADLVEALKRIVHELRQPVGAAANALATAKLRTTDTALAEELRALAGDELTSALASLEALAKLARSGAGEPLRMPATDAVTVALGAHLDEVAFVPGFDGPVEVDPSQLAHAVTSLVANALDARAVEPVRVETARGQRPDSLVVRVLDDGPEPDAGALARAAEPFFTTRAGRLGIGATAAAAFARAIGGTLEWRREGSYTVAELRVPLAQTPAPPPRP